MLGGAGTGRAWLVTHDMDTPAQALYRSLGFRELGRGALGWHDAERVVLGAGLGGRPDPAGRPQFWRFSKMPAAPWPPPTHMVTMP